MTISPKLALLKGSAEYERVRYSYWTKAQAEATPACIFQPRAASDVSLALVILLHTQCPFAIKSGGHGKFHGESSISKGVTIDLANINHITVNEDRTSVTVGPGNRWIDVYSALEPLGLTVIGGRAATVGVGGLLLGGKHSQSFLPGLFSNDVCAGGISFYSNAYGWALDNIQSYEVVLANGTIVNASMSSHPELFKALRGGGGNFGIITSFTLDAYPYTGMWGGLRCWNFSYGEALKEAFFNMGAAAARDPKASLPLAFALENGRWTYSSIMSYCDAVAEPPIFGEVKAIPTQLDDTKIQNQTEMVRSMTALYPHNVENSLWVTCAQVDQRIFSFWVDTWITEMDKILHIKGLKPQAVIHYITSNMVDRMGRNGGNSLGLAGKGPFLMFTAEPLWHEAKDSPLVFATMRTFFVKVEAEAKRLGVDHPYIYLNYANQYQNAFAGLEKQTKLFLNAISCKYDPDGVFQGLRGAGFKLDRAPECWSS